MLTRAADVVKRVHCSPVVSSVSAVFSLCPCVLLGIRGLLSSIALRLVGCNVGNPLCVLLSVTVFDGTVRSPAAFRTSCSSYGSWSVSVCRHISCALTLECLEGSSINRKVVGPSSFHGSESSHGSWLVGVCRHISCGTGSDLFEGFLINRMVCWSHIILRVLFQHRFLASDCLQTRRVALFLACSVGRHSKLVVPLPSHVLL